jgi:N-acetylated-alpha-linked acidic dipeptidase
MLGWAEAGLAQGGSMLGFFPGHVSSQLSLEKQFSDELQTADMDQWMKRLSALPHPLGSPYDKQNILFLDSLFRTWGYQTHIDTYYVLFPTPRLRRLEMVSPTRYQAVLMEKVIPSDPYTAQTALQLPPYNAYSADGNVTAEVVFVNYGIPDDYTQLEKMGISVKGKIVLAKYGRSWRGIKPKLAYEHGAIGCLIYSDPRDDGYTAGDTYPQGPYKNPYAVQRGSVMDMPVYPGDPLTPGRGATREAQRLTRGEAKTLIPIPVLPISYHDAQPLLAALKGPVAPPSWRGALPLTYHLGPGPTRVHLQLAFDWKLTPAYDLTATLPGSPYPDQWVLRGNHADAWVNGAADPVSGLVAEMSEAKSLAGLYRKGWRPKRTIVYCVWDGEEPALLGSTEWVEDHAAVLKQKAVAYINSDMNGRGYLYAGGSHTLEKFFSQVAAEVKDPEKGISVSRRQREADALQGHRPMEDFRLDALGSGSDYSPFLQHLGIASLNLSFGGEDGGGEYHTMYDDYLFFTQFKDPGFAYEKALAEVAGRSVMRLADADILPFDFTHLSRTVRRYTDEVRQLADDTRRLARLENHWIADSVYHHTSDPKEVFVAPAAPKPVPYFDFSTLDNALSALSRSASDYHHAIQALEVAPDTNLVRRINGAVYQSERQLLTEKGLPGRPWYRHLIYAPGLYTGYGVKTLPGIREAIEQGDYQNVNLQISQVSQALTNLSQFIDGLCPSKTQAGF